MSPLTIWSVRVGSSNRHQVCAGCLLSRHVILGHLALEDGTDWLSQNIRMELPLYAVYKPRRQQISKHVQFQCVLLSAECQMVQYKCVL
jgi:hypothetical protein